MKRTIYMFPVRKPAEGADHYGILRIINLRTGIEKTVYACRIEAQGPCTAAGRSGVIQLLSLLVIYCARENLRAGENPRCSEVVGIVGVQPFVGVGQAFFIFIGQILYSGVAHIFIAVVVFGIAVNILLSHNIGPAGLKHEIMGS